MEQGRPDSKTEDALGMVIGGNRYSIKSKSDLVKVLHLDQKVCIIPAASAILGIIIDFFRVYL
jgi:hypothetical protein